MPSRSSKEGSHPHHPRHRQPCRPPRRDPTPPSVATLPRACPAIRGLIETVMVLAPLTVALKG